VEIKRSSCDVHNVLFAFDICFIHLCEFYQNSAPGANR
jgi:hypothetical protein